MSRRSLQASYLRTWTIHCRLSRTSADRYRGQRVVYSVRWLLVWFGGGSDWIMILSCTSPAGNLDKSDPVLRSAEHTNACKDAFGLKTLWETYGIINEATVSSPASLIHATRDPKLISPSLSQNTSPMPIFTNLSLRIYFTNSLRGYSKTTLSSGSVSTLNVNMANPRLIPFWMRLIDGTERCRKLSHSAPY